VIATVLRAADRADQPWKNGGGRTREVIVSPPSGVTTAFDWRLSMADVKAAGPFSSFPGIDRTLRVLDGHLELSFADRAPPQVLTPDTAALDFPGDVIVTGRPLGGPVLDLNLMVRRGAYRGSIRRHPAGVMSAAEGHVAALLLFALKPTTARIGDRTYALDRFDALQLNPPRRSDPFTVDQPVLIVRIDPWGV